MLENLSQPCVQAPYTQIVDRKIIGKNIADRRRSLGISQTQLGKSIGHDRHYVSDIENGDSSIPIEELPAWLAALTIKSPSKLFVENVFRGESF